MEDVLDQDLTARGLEATARIQKAKIREAGVSADTLDLIEAIRVGVVLISSCPSCDGFRAAF
ncbi:MAG: hypothetical protein NZ743_03350 [Pseudomonadales bacterium]|nr:hypothetical protein [Pseudomonadales bacterium]